MLSILLAFFAYSLLNISQATQKLALKIAKGKKLIGLCLWIFATLCSSVSIFIVLYAVSIGNASLVGAMAGSGLASLAVFSHFVMKEKIGKKEILGIFIIISASAIIGALSPESKPATIFIEMLFTILGIITVLYVLAWIIFIKRVKIIGIIIGGFAGALGGFIPLFQKVSTSDIGKASSFFSENTSPNEGGLLGLLRIFANPYALIWIVLSIVSIVVLQFSYKRDKAIRIIPSFSTNCLLVPVIGGVLCFQEQLHFGQWIGVGLILVGLFLLTIKINLVLVANKI